MKVDENVIKTFSAAKEFKENTEMINSLDFSANGESLITSSNDDSIIIYDCMSGAPKKTLHSKKYGCDVIKFTHNTQNAIHGSTKLDDTIRYLSLHDNKYIRYFPGHNKRVVSLNLCPTQDIFISTSLDRTLRLWDLKSPSCTGLMNVNGTAVSAFDPEGLIFAAGIGSEFLRLYDIKTYDKGPFTQFKVDPGRGEPGLEWTGLKFSPTGASLMISTNKSIIKIVDAFDGRLKCVLSGFANDKDVAMEPSFSPDGKFVFCGSTDGKIHCWNAETGDKVVILQTKHTKPIACCNFNPRFMMLATSCVALWFWVPCVS